MEHEPITQAPDILKRPLVEQPIFTYRNSREIPHGFLVEVVGGLENPVYRQSLKISEREFNLRYNPQFLANGVSFSLEDEYDRTGKGTILIMRNPDGKIIGSLRIIEGFFAQNEDEQLDITDFMSVPDGTFKGHTVSLGRFTINHSIISPLNKAQERMVLRGLLDCAYQFLKQRYNGSIPQVVGIFIEPTANFVRKNGVVIQEIENAVVRRNTHAIVELENQFPGYWKRSEELRHKEPFLVKFETVLLPLERRTPKRPFVESINDPQRTLVELLSDSETPHWKFPAESMQKLLHTAENPSLQLLRVLRSGMLIHYEDVRTDALSVLKEKFTPQLRKLIKLPRLGLTVEEWIQEYERMDEDSRSLAGSFSLLPSEKDSTPILRQHLPLDLEIAIVILNNFHGKTVEEIAQKMNDHLLLSTLDLKVSIAGASVGGQIMKALAKRFPFLTFYIADPKTFVNRDVNNRNEVPLSKRTRDKTALRRESIHEEYPWINIVEFPEGVQEQNVEEFCEFALIVLDEMDNLVAKHLVKKYSKVLALFWSMITDALKALPQSTNFAQPNTPLYANVSEKKVDDLVAQYQKAQSQLQPVEDGEDNKHRETTTTKRLFAQLAQILIETDLPEEFRAHLSLYGAGEVAHIPQPTETIHEAICKAIQIVDERLQNILLKCKATYT